ncbi:PBP1A family penicillin-binding protein, partial [candidate division WOR-3 bacterium]|nr:PBP1A family penicillin-binding protein [candidate division WOR-3 bacterium]
IVFMFIAILFIWYAKDLPTPNNIKNWHPIESTHIYDRDGNLLYDVSGDIRRTVIDFEDMPESIKQATISAEDKDFYKHHGISYTGIARALLDNITGKHSYTSGGSTITQQFVKNALLSPKKTYTRKLKEVILTIEIELMYSKDEILAMYLNQIPYGSNAYGIQAASEIYFNKNAKDLTLAESAVIASLPKAPTYYSPYGQHPDKLEERKDYIIGRMAKLGYITEKQADQAKAEKLNYQIRKENITAPHFVFYVKEKLIEEYGEQMVNEGGLRVTTTLDPNKQKMAEESIANGMAKVKRYGGSNAALVSIDPKTGQVLSMVGSYDFFDTENDGQVNVAISDRQPGSSFKPIAYAAAFQGKYNPGYTLFDLTTDFGGGYIPNNYDGVKHGPVSMRYALANSLNIPAVKTLALAGIDKTIDLAHDMGISTLNDPDRYGLALVLGGGEVKLADLTTAYGVFANNGILHNTTPLLKVENRDGKILYEFNENKGKKDVLDPQIAYEISNILSDKKARSYTFGNISALNVGNRNNVAAKTGTTQEYRDAWTIGYTTTVVTGVWVGNNDNTTMRSGAAGAVVAAPIWNSYMSKVLANTPDEEFTRPEEIQDITVEKFSNKLPNSQSAETVTDIFATWQAPNEKDDANIKVTICTLCEGEKLATDECPEQYRKERTYTNIHSAMPDNPNWENPVRAWLNSHGYYSSTPPTETCEAGKERPSITITNPTQDQSVSGSFDCIAQASSYFGVKSVQFYIDNSLVGTDASEPYSISYNSNDLSLGPHTLKVKVIDNKDLTAENTVTFISNGDQTPPGNVTSVGLTPDYGSITIKWKNPSDSDLSVVRLYISTTATKIGNLYPTEISVNPNSISQYTINSLVSGTKYYFTLHPVDTSGNENQSVTQYGSTPL